MSFVESGEAREAYAQYITSLVKEMRAYKSAGGPTAGGLVLVPTGAASVTVVNNGNATVTGLTLRNSSGQNVGVLYGELGPGSSEVLAFGPPGTRLPHVRGRPGGRHHTQLQRTPIRLFRRRTACAAGVRRPPHRRILALSRPVLGTGRHQLPPMAVRGWTELKAGDGDAYLQVLRHRLRLVRSQIRRRRHRDASAHGA